MNEQSDGDGGDVGERPSGQGERRKALEQERRVFLATGQMPRVGENRVDPARVVPQPNSRRARRLAEQGVGSLPAGVDEGTTLLTGVVPGPMENRERGVESSARRGTRVLDRGREASERTATLLPVIRPPMNAPVPDVLPPAPSPTEPPPSWQDTMRGGTTAGSARAAEGVTPAAGRHQSPAAAEEGPRRRRGIILVLVLLLVLGATAGGGWFWLYQGRDTQTTVAPAPAVPQQRTLLVVLDDGSSELTSAALMAADDAGVVSVLVPGGLLVDIPGTGRRPLSTALTSSPETPAKAISDALQVRIDGTWRLTLDGLRRLTDAAGGIVVDLEEEVTDGETTIAAGDAQRLTGEQAAMVASALAEEETEEHRLARFQTVLSAVLTTLPDGPELIAERLRALGEESQILPGTYNAAPLLGDLRIRAMADGIAGTVVPVRTLTAGDTSVYGLDQDRVGELVSAQLAGARFPEPAGGAVRVLVQNGVGVPGLGEAARDRLVGAGMRYVAGGNAATFGRQRTAVLVASTSGQDRAEGVRVAVALGLTADNVAVDVLGTNLADVVVVLGEDFADDVTDKGVDADTSLPAAELTPLPSTALTADPDETP